MTEIKYPKWLKIISISIIIIGIFVISFIKYWPTYQKKIGLNYLDFNYNDYKTMIEIELSNGYDFAFIINKENKVSNVFFFNQESVILSNYDLSKKTISKDIKVIIDNLNENNNLDNIIIKIIDYNNTTLKADIEKELINNLSKKTSTYQILSEEKTLLTKAQ